MDSMSLIYLDDREGNIMFTKIFIGLFCYVFLVVRNSRKKFLIEEAKKNCSNKRNHLRKGCSKYL